MPDGESELEKRTRERFAAWRDGDDHAAAALLEMHGDFLAALVQRELGAKLRAKVEPDDVAQDVGIKLLQYDPKAEDGSIERFRALLRTMTQHVVTDLHRRLFLADKRGRGGERRIANDSQLRFDPPRDSVTSPSRAFERTEDHAMARVVVHFLPADRGDLIGLRSWFEIPFAALCARFGADESALRMRLLRAMEKAAAVLAKVRASMPRIDACDRDLILLRVDRDLSFAGMAAVLATSPVAACARFQKSMRQLGARIEEPFRPLPDDWPRCLLLPEE